MNSPEVGSGWVWHHDGDGYVAFTRPEMLVLVNECAQDMRDSAERVLAFRGPPTTVIDRNTPIAEIVYERAVAQFRYPREDGSFITFDAARGVAVHVAFDATVALLATIGLDDSMKIHDAVQREMFLWFLGDMQVAFKARARLGGDQRSPDELLRLSEWFRWVGASLDQLATEAQKPPRASSD